MLPSFRRRVRNTRSLLAFQNPVAIRTAIQMHKNPVFETLVLTNEHLGNWELNINRV
jgi:hypothetical protein